MYNTHTYTTTAYTHITLSTTFRQTHHDQVLVFVFRDSPSAWFETRLVFILLDSTTFFHHLPTISSSFYHLRTFVSYRHSTSCILYPILPAILILFVSQGDMLSSVDSIHATTCFVLLLQRLESQNPTGLQLRFSRSLTSVPSLIRSGHTHHPAHLVDLRLGLINDPSDQYFASGYIINQSN